MNYFLLKVNREITILLKLVFDDSEARGCCTKCAYFLAKSEARGAYSAGAYKKSVLLQSLEPYPTHMYI